jgi:hypothetical protein
MNFSWLELPNSRFIRPLPEYGYFLRFSSEVWRRAPLFLSLEPDLFPKSAASSLSFLFWFAILDPPLKADFGVLLRLLTTREIGIDGSANDFLLYLLSGFPLV